MAHKIKLYDGEIVECVNEYREFWGHYYVVHLADIGATPIYVNASYESHALDIAVDYAEEKGWEGYFLDESDPDFMEDDLNGEVTRAGNHCRALNGDEVHIQKLRFVTHWYGEVETDSGRTYNAPETWGPFLSLVENQFPGTDITELVKGMSEWFLDNV